MNSIYIILVVMTIIGAFAGYFLKKAAACSSVIKIVSEPRFYIGGTLYFMSALLNIYVLKYLPYTVVLPMTSITYVWTMIISYKLLGERITIYKIVGTGSILIGVIFIAIA